MRESGDPVMDEVIPDFHGMYSNSLISEQYYGTINEVVKQLAERYHNALDEMCWAMLKDKQKRGVLIEFGPGMEYRIRLSSSVPWCEIHERNSTTIEVY